MKQQEDIIFELARQMSIANGTVVSTLILAMDEAGMLSKKDVAARLLHVRDTQCRAPDTRLAAAMLTAIVDKIGEGAGDTSPEAARYRRPGGMN